MADEFKGLIPADTEEGTKVVGELKDAKLTFVDGRVIDFTGGHMEIGVEDVTDPPPFPDDYEPIHTNCLPMYPIEGEAEDVTDQRALPEGEDLGAMSEPPHRLPGAHRMDR